MKKNIEYKINQITKNNSFDKIEIIKLLLMMAKNSSIKDASARYNEFFQKFKSINISQDGILKKKILECIDYNIKLIINDKREIINKYQDIDNFFDIAFFLSEENTDWLDKRIEVSLYFIKQLDKVITVINSGYSELDFSYTNIEPHKYFRSDGFNQINILKVLIYKDLLFKCKYVDIIDDYVLLLRVLDKGKEKYFNNNFSIEELLPMFKSSKYNVNFKDLQLELMDQNIYRTIESDREILLNKMEENIVFLNKIANLEYNYSRTARDRFFCNNKHINIAINKAPKEGMLYINRAIVNLYSYDFDNIIHNIEKALEPDMIWTPEIKKFEIITRYYNKYEKTQFSKEDILYKYLDSLCKVSNNPQINHLLARYIMDLILEVEINHNLLKEILGKLIICYYINSELVEKALKNSEKAYNATQDIEYLKMIVKCLIYSNKAEKAIETIALNNNIKLDSELKYLLGFSYFMYNKYEQAHDVFLELYKETKTQENIKMYYNSLYMLKKYSELLNLYKNNELKCDEDTIKNNIDEIKKRLQSSNDIFSYGKYCLSYKENNLSNTNSNTNTSIIKNKYKYYDTELDKEYERIVKIHKEIEDYERRVEEAENMLIRAPDRYVDWLGGVETEEEFWEHTD